MYDEFRWRHTDPDNGFQMEWTEWMSLALYPRHFWTGPAEVEYREKPKPCGEFVHVGLGSATRYWCEGHKDHGGSHIYRSESFDGASAVEIIWRPKTDA